MNEQKILDTIIYKNDIGRVIYTNTNKYTENSVEFQKGIEGSFCKSYDYEIKNIIFTIEKTNIDGIGNLVITSRTFDIAKILQQQIPIGVLLLSVSYFATHSLGMLVAALGNFLKGS